MAVMASPSTESLELIKYLIDRMPGSLEKPSLTRKLTPLALAFSLRHYEAAKLLINAGADQTTRDISGCNIIHLLLFSDNGDYSGHFCKKEDLQKHLDLIDERLVPSLLTQRSSYEQNSETPLCRYLGWHRTIYYSYTSSREPEIVRSMLDFSKVIGNEDLEMFDGSGDTPVHFVVKNSDRDTDILRVLLEYRPDLLHRENSVGRTPYELAEDAYIAECVKDPPCVTTSERFTSILDRSVDSFVEESDTGSTRSLVKRKFDLCEEFVKEFPGKRTLVSLADANEVAKRLASRQQQERRRYERVGSDAGSDDGSGKVTARDEVDLYWYRTAREHLA